MHHANGSLRRRTQRGFALQEGGNKLKGYRAIPVKAVISFMSYFHEEAKHGGTYGHSHAVIMRTWSEDQVFVVLKSFVDWATDGKISKFRTRDDHDRAIHMGFFLQDGVASEFGRVVKKIGF